jgi:hypothetical protein
VRGKNPVILRAVKELASPPSSKEGRGKKYCHPESSEGTSLTSSSREGEGKKYCHPEWVIIVVLKSINHVI